VFRASLARHVLGYDVQQGNFVFGGLIEGSLCKISGSASISSDIIEDDFMPAGVEENGFSNEVNPSAGSAKASYSNLMSVAVRGGPLVNDGTTLLYGRLGMSRAKLEVELPDASGSSPEQVLMSALGPSIF